MNLKRQALRAGRSTAISTVLVTALQFLQTIVLARLLVPAEFGLMAIAASLLTVVGLFSDLGLSRALVHFDEMSPETLSTLYWLNLAMGIALAMGFMLAAPLVGTLYESPRLVPVLQLAALLFPLVAAGQQFRVLAEKELRFGTLAGIEVAAALIGVGAALGIASQGGGVFALVGGILARAASASVFAWWFLAAGRRPSFRMRFSEARPYLKFGGYLVGDSLANTLQRQADIFIGGTIAGPAALGTFAVPRDLGYRISIVVNPILTRVGFPVMSRVKDHPDRLRNIYLHTLRMTASVNFPLYLGLALFADEVVALLYGPQWRAAGPYLEILALWGLLRSIGNPVGSLLYASGRARLAFWWNVGLLALVPPLLWLGARAGGLHGLAWTLLAIQAAVIWPAWRLLVQPLCGATLRQYTAAFATPLLLALVAVVAGHQAAAFADGGVARLATGIAIAVPSYALLSVRFNRTWADAMREVLHLRMPGR